MALPFFYIPLNISIHLNTIISKCGLVCVYWLQICTLCQLQLLLLQSLFQVIRWHCKTTLLHSTLLTYCFTASPAKTGQCLHICLQHYNILNLYTTHTHKKTILEASLSTQPIFLPHFLECLFLSFCWESAININQILFTTSQLTTWVFFLMRCTLMMFAWIYSWVRLTRGNKTGTRAAK